MPKNKETLYSLGGNLYGPGHRDMAELEKNESFKKMKAAAAKKASREDPAAGTGNERMERGGTPPATGLAPEDYSKASEEDLSAELARRGLEAGNGATKAQMVKVLKDHDKLDVNS